MIKNLTPEFRTMLAAAMTHKTEHTRNLVVVSVDTIARSPDWGCETRAGAQVAGVWFHEEPSALADANGKPRTTVVPAVVFSCDGSQPLVHREFCWCMMGMEISSKYDLTFVGAYMMPNGQVIALYEKELPTEMRVPPPQGG